jgi:hypothetical protein
MVPAICNYALLLTAYVESNSKVTANKEWERKWRRAVVTYFNIIYQNLPVRTEENYENISRDNGTPNGDLNPRPSEYEVRVLTTQGLYG